MPTETEVRTPKDLCVPMAARWGTDSVLARRWPPPLSASSAQPAALAVAGFRRTRHCKLGQEGPPMAMPDHPRAELMPLGERG